MEENTVELIDYCRVVWKRKILIIVVISVCMVVGVGVGVMNSRKKPKVEYRAEVVVKIGKKVNLAPFTGGTASVDYIEKPAHLVTILPLRHESKVEEALRYHLEVKKLGLLGMGMIRIIMQGDDEGVERGLKVLVDKLIDEHLVMAKTSVTEYKNIIRKLEEHAGMLRREIDRNETSVEEMKRKGEEYLMHIDSSKEKEGKEREREREGEREVEGWVEGDRSAFLNMLYLRTIDKEGELARNWDSLRSLQLKLSTHRITFGKLEDYRTEKFSEIKSTTVRQKKKNTNNFIMTAGIVGLIMSFVIAFFIEYIEESKSRRKGKWQG